MQKAYLLGYNNTPDVFQHACAAKQHGLSYPEAMHV